MGRKGFNSTALLSLLLICIIITFAVSVHAGWKGLKYGDKTISQSPLTASSADGLSWKYGLKKSI